MGHYIMGHYIFGYLCENLLLSPVQKSLWIPAPCTTAVVMKGANGLNVLVPAALKTIAWFFPLRDCNTRAAVIPMLLK